MVAFLRKRALIFNRPSADVAPQFLMTRGIKLRSGVLSDLCYRLSADAGALSL